MALGTQQRGVTDGVAGDAEERYRQLLEDANDVIYTHDVAGRFLSINSAVRRTYGYEPEELVGQPIAKLVDPAYLPTAAANLRKKASGEAERTPPYELLTRAKDGHAVWVEVSTRALVQGGQVVGIQGIARDVTDRHRREEAEARIREHEHREVERLEEMEHYKSEFLRMAAHELGTPLTPLRIQVRMLREWTKGGPDRKAAHAVDVLDRNLDRLHRLVNDLLEAARLQCGRLTIEPAPVDMVRLVREVVDTYQPAAREAGLELEAELPPCIELEADPARVAQVVTNLVSNSVKYTPRGGRIAVRCSTIDDAVRVTVADSGIGFTPAQASVLFQPFTQVHDIMQANLPGTGLGLYISKGIIEQHGGAIGCESPGPGCGADFWFTLPKLAPAGGPVRAQPRSTQPVVPSLLASDEAVHFR